MVEPKVPEQSSLFAVVRHSLVPLRDHEAIDALKEIEHALTALRDAWNMHMEHCPQPRTYGVTPEQIEAWKNAPSDTASGL